MVRSCSPPGPVGFILPTFTQDSVPTWAQPIREWGTGPDPMAELADTCRRAEELGADAIWSCDHLFWHGPCLESMMVLAVAATATRRATLGTGVLQLPLRRAGEVAKQAATLQSLTAGRFVLGVGVGSHEGEYVEADIDFHRRGQLLDAGIRELRRSWAADEDAGAHTPYRQLPVPPTVPVWIGGSSEAALRRAAELGDGWMPLFLTPEAYGQALQRLYKEVERVGRPEGSVVPAMTLFVSVDDDPTSARDRGTQWMSSLYALPAKAFDRHIVAGTADDVARTITAFRQAGARHVALYITDDHPLSQFEGLMAALAGAPLRSAAGAR